MATSPNEDLKSPRDQTTTKPTFSSYDTEDSSLRDATIARITKTSSILTTLVAGLALFSDGYNAQVIGYTKPLLTTLYPETMSSTISTRLTNSYLIGEIFGMLFFGWAIDKIGRRTGIAFTTLFLVVGVVLASKFRPQEKAMGREADVKSKLPRRERRSWECSG